MADKEVKYKISLEDKFSGGMNKADRSVEGFDKSVQKSNTSTTSFIKKLGIVAGAGLALKKAFDVVRISQSLGAEMEKTEIAFGTFLGSAEKGKQVIAELNEFANVTPFDNEEIIKSGRVLLSANVPAEKLNDTLKTLGDIAAGTNVPITDLGNIYAKAMNKGKLQAEELNQLAERGIPIIDVLSKEFGITKQEVFDLGSKGKITSDVMNKAFKTMTKQGGLFFNLMQKQSASASGLLSTFSGKMKLAGVELGKRMLPSVKKTTKQLIGFADALIRVTKVPMSEELEKTRIQLDAELEILKRGTLSADERKDAIQRINTEYKDYLPNLLNENSTLQEIEQAQRAANQELLKKIDIQAKEEILQKQIDKTARARLKFRESELELVKFQRRVQEGLTKDEFQALAIAGRNAEVQTQILESNKNKRERIFNEEKNNLDELSDRLGEVFGQQQEDQRLRAATITTEPGRELKAGIQTIKSAAPKTLNINVAKFVENFNVKSETINESAVDVRTFFEEQFAIMLADIQAAGG